MSIMRTAKFWILKYKMANIRDELESAMQAELKKGDDFYITLRLRTWNMLVKYHNCLPNVPVEVMFPFLVDLRNMAEKPKPTDSMWFKVTGYALAASVAMGAFIGTVGIVCYELYHLVVR